MSTTLIIATAAWVGFSLLRRADLVVQPLIAYGVPRTR